VTAAIVAGLVAVTAVVGLARFGAGHRAAAPPPPATPSRVSRPAAGPSQPSAQPADVFGAQIVVPQDLDPTAAPGPQPTAAPGTFLLTCDAALSGLLDPDWRAASLRVGSLWLVGGRQYARVGRAGPADRARRGPGQVTARREVQMLVHVDAGSTVIMRAAAGSSKYFQFTGAGLGSADLARDGDRGFTFVPCPRGVTSAVGWTDFYDLGFSIVPGHAATVEVLTSPSARPVWLTFTAPTKAA